MLHFLLCNVYIQADSRVFKQCIGIPMGTNYAPCLLTCCCMITKAQLWFFSPGQVRFPSLNPSVWQDDTLMTSLPLTTPIWWCHRQNLPIPLTLKETNLSDHRVAYLDRQFEIEQGKLVVSLYDKLDDFPFKVQNYTHSEWQFPIMPMYQPTSPLRSRLW